jgi:hypothetical protein
MYFVFLNIRLVSLASNFVFCSVLIALGYNSLPLGFGRLQWPLRAFAGRLLTGCWIGQCFDSYVRLYVGLFYCSESGANHSGSGTRDFSYMALVGRFS